MAKVGLKDTLALLAKGYSKKEIDALAAIDEEQEAPAADQARSEVTAPVEDKKAPDDAAVIESNPEPDYKKMYEDLVAKHEKTEKTLKQIQQDNVHKDSAPAAAEQKKMEQESLTNLVRGFM